MSHINKSLLLGILAFAPLQDLPRAEASPREADKPTLHVIIGLGQSLMVGAQAANSLVSVDPVWPEQALMFDTGRNSDVRMGLPTMGDRESVVLEPESLVGFKPLVAARGQGGGSRGETPMESMVNTLTAKANESGDWFLSLSFTAAFGGSRYRDIKKGTQVYENMLVALRRAMELAEEQGWDVVVAGCLVKHGEGDANNPDYYNDLLEWRDDVDTDVKAITGQESDVHFIMAPPAAHRGNSNPYSALAMLKAHNASPYHHISGPDYPFGGEFAPDELHMTGPGYYLIGEQMARAWEDVIVGNADKSRVTQITGAQRRANQLILRYEVPIPPLVFDTDTIPERDTKGFRVVDSEGDVSIASVEITDDASVSGVGEITIRLAAEPSGSDLAVLYALSPQSNPRTEEARVRGNVRDSATRVSTLDGRPLYNWAVMQRVSAERP